MEPIPWSRIVDGLGDAVIAADRSGRILYANGAVSRLLGWHDGDLVGQPLTVLMPQRMRQAHEAGFQRYASTGVPRLIGRAVRVPAVRRDGAELDVELTLSALRLEQGELFVASLRDLRDRVELERQLSVTQQMAAATRAATRLSEGLDLEHVLSVTVTTLTREFDAALARVWLGDPASRSLELKASAGLSTRIEGSSRQRIDLDTYPFKVGMVARTRRPFLSNELTADPEFEQDWIAREGLRSCVILPLLRASELRGVVAAFFRRRLEEELFEVLQAFGAMVAAALENARLYAQAQEAIKARDEFLAMASHELRTPLQPLVLSLESVRRVADRSDADASETVERVKERVASAQRATAHIERLVARMLDVSRLHERRLDLHPRRLDLVALLREIVERHRPHADALGCTLELRAPATLEGTWDPLRLDQIISNLVSNAIKYGRSLPIVISVDAADEQVTLTVADRGIGIAPTDLGRVFDRFERAVSSDEYGGFGLGLWITRELAQAMGGTVSVESQLGQGSAFTVVLPREGPPSSKERGAA